MKRRNLIAGCFSGALACAAALVLLTGCDSTEEHYQIQRTAVVVELAGMPADVPPTVLGRAVQKGEGAICRIELREYPTCLLHEIRHCFEDNWHAGRDTTEGCHP